MSGHSKWHSIKHTKGKLDAQRGKLFTRLARDIIVAAKCGGGNPDANITLRAAITRAREASVPQDNIKRAIARGVGRRRGRELRDPHLRGLRPRRRRHFSGLPDRQQAAHRRRCPLLLQQERRAVGQVRQRLVSVHPKGVIVVDPDVSTEEAVTEAAIEGGAEDIQPTEDGGFEITTAPADLAAVQQALEDAKIKYASAEQTMIPTTTVPIAGKEAAQVLRLVDMLEDHDDVQTVYANFDIPESELEAVEAGR